MEILPVLDTAILQEKANEHAMKGAIESFKEFYSGYNSPYRKAIEEDLKGKDIGIHICLPDIIGLINDSLSAEVTRIANEAVAKSFLPIVQKFLTRTEPEINFTAILKEFISHVNDDGLYPDDYYIDVEKEDKWGWLTIKISARKHDYQFTLHEDRESKKEGNLKYWLGALPYPKSSYSKTMKLTVGDGTLEMPFTQDVLSDDFMSYMGRIVISKSLITMDQDYFSEDMFPDRCHC